MLFDLIDLLALFGVYAGIISRKAWKNPLEKDCHEHSDVYLTKDFPRVVQNMHHHISGQYMQ